MKVSTDVLQLVVLTPESEEEKAHLLKLFGPFYPVRDIVNAKGADAGYHYGETKPNSPFAEYEIGLMRDGSVCIEPGYKPDHFDIQGEDA